MEFWCATYNTLKPLTFVIGYRSESCKQPHSSCTRTRILAAKNLPGIYGSASRHWSGAHRSVISGQARRYPLAGFIQCCWQYPTQRTRRPWNPTKFKSPVTLSVRTIRGGTTKHHLIRRWQGLLPPSWKSYSIFLIYDGFLVTLH